jgi:glycosyltransferase involved in cell wall biosynthesis
VDVAHLVKTQAVAGAENHLFKLLPGLAASGCHVDLIVIRDRSKGAPTAAFEAALRQTALRGVSVHRLSVASKFDPAGTIAIARLLRRLRPQIVHTHLPYADLFGALGARLARGSLVVSSRHRDYSSSAAVARRFRWHYRLANPWHDVVIAISGRIAELCRTQEGREASTIRMVWYGCEEQAVDRREARAAINAELTLQGHELLLGTVGRLIPLKGHASAVDALATVVRVRPDTVWMIAGSGPEHQRLEAKVRALGLERHVRFLGDREDVARIMAAIDLLVHPTTAEGFGLVVLEAMVQGTPVVASRVGALPELVIDGETGLLVESSNAQALAEGILALGQDADRRHRLGRAARRRYEEHFRLERMVDETLQVYRSVMADH